jgi:stage III sporulation protein AH
MLSKKQKIISASALTCLIILAGILNFTLARNGNNSKQAIASKPAQTTQAKTTVPDTAMPDQAVFFESFKDQREQSRQQETEYLESILNDEKTDDTTRKAAQEQLMTIVANSEAELSIEGLLQAKGFNDVAVSIHNGTVSVIVGEATLTSAQVAQILEISAREGKVEANNVKIIPATVQNN